jgi:hypothetical protein
MSGITDGINAATQGALFIPDSKVYFLNVPLDNTYKNQILFTSRAEQTNYFLSRVKHTFEDVTYVRKDNVIKMQGSVDYLWDSNYIMYQNSNYNGRWFYAFITKMEYCSDIVTNVYIETDVYQTWSLDTSMKRSFVVREHVHDDTYGLHIVDEGLEYGDYKMTMYLKSGKFNDYSFIMGVSDITPLSELPDIFHDMGLHQGGFYGNVFSGLSYICFYDPEASISDQINTVIAKYAEKGKSDAIAVLFTLPHSLTPSVMSTQVLPYWIDVVKQTKSFSPNFNDICGYVPKNKKLFCYPYRAMYVSNNNGQSAEYKIEMFDDPTNITFELSGSISPNCKLMCAPTSYMGIVGTLYEYGITLGDFPLCAWTNDAYSNWLAQNKVSLPLSIASGYLSVASGMQTQQPLAVAGGLISIADALSQKYKASLQPDQARGNTMGGTLNVALGTQDFYFSFMRLS